MLWNTFFSKRSFFYVLILTVSVGAIFFNREIDKVREAIDTSFHKSSISRSSSDTINDTKNVLAAADIIIDNPSANVVGDWATGPSSNDGGGGDWNNDGGSRDGGDGWDNDGGGDDWGSGSSDKYGNDYRYQSRGNGSRYVRYTPNITSAGEYDVYEWHPAGTNRPRDAQHVITYDGGTRTINVNQQVNGGEWNLLGRFRFASGTSGNVKITDVFTNESNTVVMADAIRFISVSSVPQPTPVPVGTDACEDKPLDIMIVFDHTGSMGQTGDTGETKIAVAKRAAKDFVDIIATNLPSARIGLVKWAGNQNFPNNPETSVAVGLTSNFSSVKSGIDNVRDLRGQGDIASSCFECGIKLANDHLQANARSTAQKVEIFLTDGNVNQTINGSEAGVNENDPAAEDAAMRQAQDGVSRQNIVYYTVGLLGGQHASEPFLRDLAGLNGGTYYGGSESQLQSIFQELANTFSPRGQISGFVFEDRDSDSVFDSGEPKLPNWTVKISGGKTAQTDSSGNYALSKLCTGDYTVSQVAQSGWSPTTPTSRVVSVTNGTTYSNIAFGNERIYTISGNVYIDTNGNGIKDSGELNYTGPLSLSSGRGIVTTSAGSYTIQNVVAGSQMQVAYTSLPTGYVMTYPLTGPPPSFTVNVGSSCTVNGARGATCSNGNITNLNFGIQRLYTVSGNVYIDGNRNGVRDIGESNYTGSITITSGRGLVTTSGGSYTIRNITAGSSFTVSYTSLPPNYIMSYPLTGPPPSFTVNVGSSCTVNGATGASCSNGNIGNLNFGIQRLYTISGNVYIDGNKNGVKDSGEPNYTGSIIITSDKGTLTTSAGSYTIQNLSPGSVLVSYRSLPSDYVMTHPLNGPPPSFSVNVGSSCSTNGARGATCTNGDMSNLSFGISNLYPWFQSTCGDIRIDSGIINRLYAGNFALVSSSSCTNPGKAFSGNSSYSFGQGQISSTNWIVGGTVFPETYQIDAPILSSYASLSKKTAQGGITPTDLVRLCSISNCTLPSNLPHGVYGVNSNITLNGYTFPVNQSYVFLVNGDLTINGPILVPSGSSVVFAVTGNIIVDGSVGSSASSTAPSIEGIYTTDRSFIANSAGTCADRRLNIGGSVVVNAGATGGRFQNNRDLCDGNRSYPTVSFVQRLDFLFNLPTFMRTRNSYSWEAAP